MGYSSTRGSYNGILPHSAPLCNLFLKLPLASVARRSLFKQALNTIYRACPSQSPHKLRFSSPSARHSNFQKFFVTPHHRPHSKTPLRTYDSVSTWVSVGERGDIPFPAPLVYTSCNTFSQPSAVAPPPPAPIHPFPHNPLRHLRPHPHHRHPCRHPLHQRQPKPLHRRRQTQNIKRFIPPLRIPASPPKNEPIPQPPTTSPNSRNAPSSAPYPTIASRTAPPAPRPLRLSQSTANARKTNGKFFTRSNRPTYPTNSAPSAHGNPPSPVPPLPQIAPHQSHSQSPPRAAKLPYRPILSKIAPAGATTASAYPETTP